MRTSIRFIRIFECFVAVLVVGVCICFAIELAYIPEEVTFAANKCSADLFHLPKCLTTMVFIPLFPS